MDWIVTFACAAYNLVRMRNLAPAKQRKVDKIRMEPSVLQSDELLRMAGAARFIWNWALDRCKTFYREDKKGIPQSQLSDQLTALKGKQRWLYDFDSQSLQQVHRNLKQAYENHFHPKMRPGFPQFKTKKNTQQSLRIPQRVVLRDGQVYVPKPGWVQVRQSQDIEGETKSATFKRTATGKWCVALVVEFEMHECKPPCFPEQVVGGDLGLGSYLALSDGTEIENPRFSRQYARKLRRAQRQLSRKQKGGTNRNQARIKVARIHERISNLHQDFSHQLTHRLMQYPLCLENLSILGLAKTKLAKSMLDAPFRETLRQWKYKALRNNNYAWQADRFFPSTQQCNRCGFQNKNLSLSDREWQCPECETQHNRDLNSALNLRNEGIKQLVAAGSAETQNACEQRVRPTKVGNAA